MKTAAERGERVVHGDDRAAGGGGGDRSEQSRVGNAEAGFFAFQVAAGLGRAGCLINVSGGEQRIALLLEINHRERGDYEENRHRGQHRPTLAGVTDQAAEGMAQRARNEKNRQHLQKIGQRCRILKGMRRVGVEETAAVGADHLDRFLGGDRSHGQGLCGVFQRGHVLIGGEILNHPLTDQNHREHQRQRQQHVKRNPRQVNPGVADVLRGVTGESI